MSHTLDMTRLIATPTRQPKMTSATLCTPCAMPAADDSCLTAAAMTTAAVIGACRHIVLMRTTYEDTRTVVANASGRIQGSVPPRTRKTRPAAPPTTTLTRRLLNIRRASTGCGSDAAIIDAMAQIG